MNKTVKSAFLMALTVTLISATAVAVTWAVTYQSGDFGSKTNTFTSTDKIKLGASEPGWTGTQTYKSSDGYKDSNGGNSPDAIPDGVTNGSTDGETLALKYYSNQTIPKDPRLTNTTNAASGFDGTEYVGMQAKFYVWVDDGDASTTDDYKVYPSYDAFKACIATVQTGTGTPAAGFNTGNSDKQWTSSSNKTDFYTYNNSLADKTQTTNLFDSVKINAFTEDSTNNAPTTYTSGTNGIIHGNDGKYSYVYYDGSIPKRAVSDKAPKFKIELTGYAVHAKSFESGGSIPATTPAAAITALEGMVS